MMKRERPIFKRYPLDGRVTVAGEELTTPYHVYDGAMLCLGGTVVGSEAAALLARENLMPVLDSRGRALAAVWVCDFVDANLGAHHELQISLFARYRPAPPLPANPFAFFRALAKLPDLRMVCHGLWNNTHRVVRYNAEHLRLGAALTVSEMERGRERWTFRFRDAEGHLIAEGAVPVANSDIGLAWRIAGQMGVGPMMRLLGSPAFRMPVVNTRRPSDDLNHVCETFTSSERQSLRRARAQDEVVIAHPVYRRLEFKPEFIQQLNGVGFIFLRPEPLT